MLSKFFVLFVLVSKLRNSVQVSQTIPPTVATCCLSRYAMLSSWNAPRVERERESSILPLSDKEEQVGLREAVAPPRPTDAERKVTNQTGRWAHSTREMRRNENYNTSLLLS